MSLFAIFILLMTTVSTNAKGNIIPAGYQLSALFPKKLNYKKGVLIAGFISYFLLPWKLMEDADSIFVFLNAIGAILGPVGGVMLVHFLFTSHSTIDLNQLYFDKHQTSAQNSMYYGLNKKAYIATFFGIAVVGVVCLFHSSAYFKNLHGL